MHNGDEELSNARQAMTDAFGHGTHVAGIIGGMLTGPSVEAVAAGNAHVNAQGTAPKPPPEEIIAVARQHSESGDVDYLPVGRLSRLRSCEQQGQG